MWSDLYRFVKSQVFTPFHPNQMQNCETYGALRKALCKTTSCKGLDNGRFLLLLLINSMAAKNSVKCYLQDGFYHLYNRGVAKGKIFLDEQDYNVFLSYLKTYLLPKDLTALNLILASGHSQPQEKDQAQKLLKLKNFNKKIDLIAYVLMPNHWHLLVKQTDEDTIDRFLNALGARYAGYFNRKYKRVGPLFQGVYKAVLIESDEQFLHLSRYIHLNPIKIGLPHLPSSLPEFLGRAKTDWLKPDYILNYFSKTNPHDSYESFMGENIDADFIAEAAIDFEDEVI